MAFLPQPPLFRHTCNRPNLQPARPKRLLSPQSAPVATAAAPRSDSADAPSNVDSEWKLTKVRARRQMRGGGRVRRGHITPQGVKHKFQKLAPNPPGLRISAGTARGRRLKSPDVYLRPMMSRVREALFSMLDGFGALREDGTVLDLFAGSGSVGIEALSRGMGRGVFVDFSLECVKTISDNIAHCGFESRAEAVCATAQGFLEEGVFYNQGRHYDLITITPPYEEVDYEELMNSVAASDCVGEGTFVVVEYPVELKYVPPAIGFRLVGMRNRRYGRTVVALYACQPDANLDRRPEEFVDVRRK